MLKNQINQLCIGHRIQRSLPDEKSRRRVDACCITPPPPTRYRENFRLKLKVFNTTAMETNHRDNLDLLRDQDITEILSISFTSEIDTNSTGVPVPHALPTCHWLDNKTNSWRPETWYLVDTDNHTGGPGLRGWPDTDDTHFAKLQQKQDRDDENHL